MRLADYVVSYSLQVNNRCLRYLAESDAHGGASGAVEGAEGFAGEVHAVYAESLLARDSRRLASMWALMQPGWKHGAEEFATHVAALKVAAGALTDASSHRRLALRLASLASEDHEAQAILKVARKLPTEIVMTWDLLNDLFAADSHCWRNSTRFRSIEDEVLQQRIARSYRKSYRQAAALTDATTNRWLDEHDHGFYRRVQLTTHQLELLRPGLSEKGKAQLWYLDKMSDTLRTRTGLRDLRRATRKVKVKKAVCKLVTNHIEQQIQKMDKRIVRLAQGCFGSKPKRFDLATRQAVAALGLSDVSLMKSTATQTESTATPTENVYG